MTYNALFIGGPEDGRRQVIDHTPDLWHFETMPDADAMFYQAIRDTRPSPIKFEAVRHTYRQVSFSPVGLVNGACLYVHSSVTDWMAALIDGYRGARS